MAASICIDRKKITWYFRTVIRLAVQPANFFKETVNQAKKSHGCWFLLISSCLGAFFVFGMNRANSVPAVAHLFNSLGMPVIAASLAFPFARALKKAPLPLLPYFGPFAYGGGLYALLSAMPAFFWPSQLINWTIIAMGLRHGMSFRKSQIALILLMEILLSILFFKYLFLLIAACQGFKG